MKIADVQELLAFIASLDRRPFPEGAVEAWHRVLASVQAQDARQAAEECARLAEAPQWTPGLIYRRAKVLEANRERANNRAIEAGPTYRDPTPEYREFRRSLAAMADRLGDLNRSIRRRPADSPVLADVDPEVFERQRAAALAALESAMS